MARQRSIHPGFFKNEELGDLEPLARLLFAGLWCWADKDGRLEDRPKRLKADILPYDNADGESLIQQLTDHGFLLRYEVNGGKYLQIINWESYQRPHPKEAVSEFPAPFTEGNGISMESNGKGEPKENPRETLGEPFQSIPSMSSIPSVPSCKTPNDDDDARDRAAKVYQNEIGVCSPIAKEKLYSWIDDYGAEWVIEAIKEAVAHNVRSPAYIAKILQGWHVNGFKVRPVDTTKTARGKPAQSSPMDAIQEAMRRCGT